MQVDELPMKLTVLLQCGLLMVLEYMVCGSCDEVEVESTPHTIAFKCIGATRDDHLDILKCP